MLKARPSRAILLVRPVIACLETVYARAIGLGVCAARLPLLIMLEEVHQWQSLREGRCDAYRPPGGCCCLNILKASREHRADAIRLISRTDVKFAMVISFIASEAPLVPAFWKSMIISTIKEYGVIAVSSH